MSVKAIPEGYHSVTPYLIVRDAAAALEFYKRAFGAIETVRMPGPEGLIGHAEIRVGDSPIMLADEFPEMGFRSPQSLGGAGVSLMIYVEDADAVFNAAVAAGATVLRPIQKQFYGDRSGMVQDAYGHVWTIATHIEDVSTQELADRAAAFVKATDD